MTMNRHSRRRVCLTLVLLAALAAGCTKTHPRRDPVGETFPSVKGASLDGRELAIPGDLAGRPVLLFVGYEQRTQFDIDRWMLALDQAGIDVPIYELPTIPGLVPGLLSGRIDAGMRAGIPKEDWGVVVTIYDDAPRVAEFLGDENSLPARVVLLDSSGRVTFFHDEGYSLGSLKRLRSALTEGGS